MRPLCSACDQVNSFVVIRGNSGASDSGVLVGKLAEDVVVEGNSVAKTDAGVEVDDGAIRVVVRGNVQSTE